jgi:hypothetical protein
VLLLPSEIFFKSGRKIKMEYDSGVSMILPDSIGLIENDFDDEDIVHEQTNQNEVKNKTTIVFFGATLFCIY